VGGQAGCDAALGQLFHSAEQPTPRWSIENFAAQLLHRFANFLHDFPPRGSKTLIAMNLSVA
jgi:hypothetical protein